ncbi:uncharacterized protein LOC106161607 isoform X2 [Lingula anatina]|uniref:Uncharacterized protein LOC106161607 isoform X2 n=1 Tax=Lingula anatina TaxID=7574 RepID=A0A1S3I876_LINAN|nr:uncharacterized protein LOC106161607 isoform X2 [Lingula anatina]|eukprot:XP_013394066.1 uncharacterized protein LOC106161607 isoform X2 [Lingula anatina]
MGCGASTANQVAHKLVHVTSCTGPETDLHVTSENQADSTTQKTNKGPISKTMESTKDNENTSKVKEDPSSEKELADRKIGNGDVKDPGNTQVPATKPDGNGDGDSDDDNKTERPKLNKWQTAGDEKPKETLEECLAGIEERVNLLRDADLEVFKTSELTGKMRYLSNRTRTSFAPKSVKVQRKKIMDSHYGEFFVRFLKWSFEENGGEVLFEGSADAMTNMKVAMGIIWNCTDRGPECCTKAIEVGIIELTLRILQDERLAPNELTTDYSRFLVKAILGMYHNISQNVPESAQVFRNANTLEILSRFLQTTFLTIKTKTLFVLAYITTEAENDILNASDANIHFMIELLKGTLANDKHYSVKSGYRTSELLHALNKLASNDANKEKLVEGGILPSCVQLLRPENSEEEQVLAAQCVWTLAFSEENKQKIRDEPGLMEVLERTAASPIDDISQSARGALWVIQDKLAEKANMQPGEADVKYTQDGDADDNGGAPHVMISYNWGSKPTMLRVRDYLRTCGYKVWMDVDHMTGSTLEAMAHAVEKAAVILICMSQQYKDSPSCRTEAEYAYRLRKDVVPLRLQQQYLPDGWLGIMLGTKLWFDISTEEFVNENLPRVAKEIGPRGRVNGTVNGGISGSPERPISLSTQEVVEAAPKPAPVPAPSSSVKKPVSSPHSMFPESKPQNAPPKMVLSEPQIAGPILWQHRDWTEEDIKKWLEDNDLAHIAQRFSGFNGKLLGQLVKMSFTAPGFFYKMLKEELNLSLLDILKVMEGLEQLQCNDKG